MRYFSGCPISLGDKLKVKLRDTRMSGEVIAEERFGIVILLDPILLYLDQPFASSHNAIWEKSEATKSALDLGLPRASNISWWVTLDTTILENISVDIEQECSVCKRKVFQSEKKCWWCDQPVV